MDYLEPSYDPNHPYAVDSVTSGGSTVYRASYDVDGNMTSRNGSPIIWTVDDVQGCTSAAGGRMPGAANLPESMASAAGSSTFSYGPDGNRYSQAATFNGVTTDTTYIGGLFEVVSTSTTTEYRHNIIADGEIVAVHTIDQSGNAYTDYLHYDQLGSVDTITDDQGNVIQSMSFDAFGQRRDPNNWDYDLSQNTISTLKNYTDRGYTDQEQLDNLSLVDMNGRVYDPTTGRFISADPTVPAPLFSQAFNRYSYVYNSPFQYVDPSGYGPPEGQYTYFDCTYACAFHPVSTLSALANDIIVANNMAAEVASIDIAVASTFIADNSTGMTTLAAPVSTGGTASVPSGGLAPLPPLSPSQCDCNMGGDNQVGNSMAGWQLCDAGCFAFVGMASTPNYDPQERFDPSIGIRFLRNGQNIRDALKNMPKRSVMGRMLNGRPLLGTMGTATALTDLIFAEDGIDYKNPTALEQVGYIPINRANSGLSYFSDTILGNIYQQGQFAAVGGNNWNMAMDPSTLTGANAAAYMASSLAAQADLSGTAYNFGALWMWTNNVPYPSWLSNGLQNGTIQLIPPNTIGGGNLFFKPTPPGG